MDLHFSETAEQLRRDVRAFLEVHAESPPAVPFARAAGPVTQAATPLEVIGRQLTPTTSRF